MHSRRLRRHLIRGDIDLETGVLSLLNGTVWDACHVDTQGPSSVLRSVAKYVWSKD